MITNGFAVLEAPTEVVVSQQNQLAIAAARARDRRLEDVLGSKESPDSNYGGGSYYTSVVRAAPAAQVAAEDNTNCHGCGFDNLFRDGGGWKCRRCGHSQPQFTGLVVRPATSWESELAELDAAKPELTSS